MNRSKAEKITEEFFKRRFPEKNLDFEKKCGYFGEWVGRFMTDHPYRFMDENSIKVYMGMLMEKGGIIRE